MLRITNPIMILQVKHFIHSSYFDSFGRRLHSDLLDRLEQATIHSREAERFSRDTVLEMYLPSTPSSFPSSIFLLRESKCKGCRNEEGTSVHNSKTSSPSASTRLFCLRLVTVVALLCSSSFSLLSSQPEREEKEFSEQVLGRRSLLSDITFILFQASSSCLDDVPVRASFHLRVVLYHRDCIVRVYVIRIGPNLYGTFVQQYPSVEYNFADKNELCTSPCTIRTNLSYYYELKDKQKRIEFCVSRVDFQFEDSRYKFVTVCLL